MRFTVEEYTPETGLSSGIETLFQTIYWKSIYNFLLICRYSLEKIKYFFHSCLTIPCRQQRDCSIYIWESWVWVDSIGTFFYIIFWKNFYLQISRNIFIICEIVYVIQIGVSWKPLYIKIYCLQYLENINNCSDKYITNFAFLFSLQCL